MSTVAAAPPKLVTPGDLARRLAVSRKTIQVWARLGKIPVITLFGRRRYVLVDVLDALGLDREKFGGG